MPFAKSVSPVFPVLDVDAALARFRALGFEVKAYGEKGGSPAAGGPIYGFVSSGGVELHLARTPNLDPSTNTSACYLYVDDANALYAKWSAAGVGGRFVPPSDTPYGLREFVHVDVDGNLIRVGSELRL
jgi:hypothetical protein